MGYVVTAPLVISKKQDGSDLYLYENTEVPDFVKADELERLSGLGLVAELSADASTDTKRRAAKKPTSESN